MAPRTAMQVMADQQKMIQDLNDRVANLVARSEAQDETASQILAVAKAQQGQLERLTRGLQHFSSLAGVEAKVATAMGLKQVQADVFNPAQPVPEPPAVPPTMTTEQAKTPEAFADVQAPGLVPNSTNDVAADVTTTAFTPGQDVGGHVLKRIEDVTAPVEGTQTQRPLDETRTETDVRVGNPMNPSTGFPLQNGFANAQRISSVQDPAEQSNRVYASMHLARLRIQAGLVKDPNETDLSLGRKIETTAGLSTEAIEQEIGTLTAVLKQHRQAAKQAQASQLVPKSAAAARPAPPLSGNGRSAAPVAESDEDLFLG